MTQPQLSVRERARKMFDEKFGYKSIDFHDGYDGDGWNGASMVKSAGCNDCAKCQNDRQEHKDFIDQIITLAQEEKEKEILQNPTQFFRGRNAVMSKEEFDVLLKSIYLKQ